MKRYALKNIETGQYLGTKPSWGPREWTDLGNAALWSSIGPAVLAAKYLLRKRSGFTGYLTARRLFSVSGNIKLVEFEMVLIDSSIGFINKQQLEEQNVEIKDRKKSSGS